MSYCYSTLIGWYRIETNSHEDYRGCIYGHKTNTNYEEPTNEMPGKQVYYVRGGNSYRRNGY